MEAEGTCTNTITNTVLSLQDLDVSTPEAAGLLRKIIMAMLTVLADHGQNKLEASTDNSLSKLNDAKLCIGEALTNCHRYGDNEKVNIIIDYDREIREVILRIIAESHRSSRLSMLYLEASERKDNGELDGQINPQATRENGMGIMTIVSLSNKACIEDNQLVLVFNI